MNLRLWNLALAAVCLAASATAQSGDGEAARLADAGQQALAAGKYSAAQQDFEQLIKLEPGVAEVHATLAVIYFKQRQYEAALHEIQTARRLKPALPRLDSLQGVSLAELGKFSEALPGLEKGFKQTADTEIRRMCGLQLLRAYTGLNRDADAVITALALNKAFPDDPEVLYNTGRIYGNIAYVTMEKLHDDAADSIWMLQAQGEAYESQKEYDSAIAAYERVLHVESTRPGIHYRMGRVYLRRSQDLHDAKDRELAANQFQQELTVDPLNGNAAYELAQIAYDRGDLVQARQQFETLLAQRPDFEQAQVGLAGVLLESDQPAEAVPPLKKAIAIEPGDEVAWYRLARAYRLSGNSAEYAKAVAEYKRLHAIRSSQQFRKIQQDAGDITVQQTGAAEQP